MRALALLWLAVPALAQTPTLRLRGPDPALVRLGEATRVEVIIENARGANDLTLPTVDGVRMLKQGPMSQERRVIEGVRMTMSSSISWTIEMRPQRLGKFVVPPIAVDVAGHTERTKEITFECVKDVRGQDLGFLRVTCTKPRVYVHEPIRFEVEYGIDGTLTPLQGRASNNQPYSDIEVQAPWLDELEGAVTIEDKKPAGSDAVLLVLNGKLLTASYDKAHVRDGRAFHRFTFTRSFLPAQLGKQRLQAPLLRYQVTRGRDQNDFTGLFERSRGENFYVYGKELEIEVLPIPELGRPSPYYGAIGRFTIAARVDQPRVKVGNSARLVLTITGSGNTEFLKVPPLDEVPGLHLLGKTEKRSAGVVEATYDLRVVSADTKGIPAQRWNFFDTTPGVERFVELTTEPIVLDVVPLEKGEGLAPLPDAERKAITPGVDDIFDMKPSASVPLVLAPPPPRAITLLLVLAPWLAFALLALFVARRAARRADVAGARARHATKRLERALRAGDPHGALVAYVADRLNVDDAAILDPELVSRLQDAGAPIELAKELASAVEAGTAHRYGGSGGVDAARVRTLAERLASVALRASALLLCATLAFAQGEQAYRSGEYAAAARAFAHDAAREGADRRAHYNLGNALWRQGKHGEALLAWERARLAMPRDPELRFNIALAEKKLELTSHEGESFATTLARLRESCTREELVLLAILANALAAALLILCWRRRALRAFGWIALVPALALALEVALLGPLRPPRALVITADSALVSEPRAGLEPIAKMRCGVKVDVLGAGPEWVRVRAGERVGYVRAMEIGVVD